MAYLRPLIQRRRSAKSASIASIAGALLTAFILIQLVLLANHRHHTLTATAVLHLHSSSSSSVSGSSESAQQPAASTTTAPPQAATAQHGKLAPKEQQHVKKQQQQQLASKGAAGVAQHAHTANKSNSNEQDVEGVFFRPSSARYRQRLSELEAGPQGQQLLSAAFAPLRISQCSSHMPQHWAPCQNIPDVSGSRWVCMRVVPLVKFSDGVLHLLAAHCPHFAVPHAHAQPLQRHPVLFVACLYHHHLSPLATPKQLHSLKTNSQCPSCTHAQPLQHHPVLVVSFLTSSLSRPFPPSLSLPTPNTIIPLHSTPQVDIEYAEEVIYPPIVLRIPGVVWCVVCACDVCSCFWK